MEQKYEKTPPGRYNAKPADWRFAEIGEKGTPAVQVRMEFMHENRLRILTWTGYLSDKAKSKTMEALFTMGFRDRDLTRFCDGAKGGALKRDQEVSITVEHEERDGKTYERVRWVNPIGGAAFKDAMDEMTAKAKASAFSIDAEMMELFQKNNIDPSESASPGFTDNDIPF